MRHGSKEVLPMWDGRCHPPHTHPCWIWWERQLTNWVHKLNVVNLNLAVVIFAIDLIVPCIFRLFPSMFRGPRHEKWHGIEARADNLPRASGKGGWEDPGLCQETRQRLRRSRSTGLRISGPRGEAMQKCPNPIFVGQVMKRGRQFPNHGQQPLLIKIFQQTQQLYTHFESLIDMG